MEHEFVNHLRSLDGVHPLLLSPPQPQSLLDVLRRLRAAVLGPPAKQLQRLLSSGNKHLGRPFLSGNFAPVHIELHATQLPLVTASSSTRGQEKAGAVDAGKDTDSRDQVHLVASSSSTAPAAAATAGKLFGAAELPAGLSGAFLRIGPNPLLAPMGGYHWFDGDGMMHAVRIKDRAASYCNRWVPTSRLAQEHAAGWPLFLKLGDYVGMPALALLALHRIKRWLGIVDTSAGGGTANTAMVAHASRLLALHEGDLPHAMRLLCDGLLEAVGRVMVSQPTGKSFTAHPKLDPMTGELHFFSYNFDATPYVSYGVLGPQGDLQASLDIGAANIKRPVMMHDFAITQNWAVFMDHPLCFDGERMVKERNLPFKFQPEQGSRIGLLPRGASDDSGMVWFELPPHMVFHVANAWEEPDGVVKLFVCHSESISLNLDTRTAGDIPQAERPRLAVVTLDPTAAASGRQGSLRLMTATTGDFPTINPAFVGRKNRYAYVATMVTGFGAAVKWDGVAKMDLWATEGSDAVVARIKLPDNCFNGETVFVPRHEDASRCAGEDDGYLVTFVHDEDAGSSSLVVWDALSMAPQPVAVVALPQRVPYGFHGLWLTERQVQEQLRGAELQPKSAAAPAAE